jgi:hypothetical protein
MEVNGQVTIANRSRYFLQYIENFTVRLGPCFLGLQTLDVQFSSCNGASNTSFWALQELLEMPACTSTRLTRLCLLKAVVFLDNFVDFARRQPMVQEIVESRLSPASAFGLACYPHALCPFCMVAVALLTPVGKRS